MFYHWLYKLSIDSTVFSSFNVFRYITFRSFMAFIIAMVISIIFGKHFIKFIKRKQFGQIIREDGPQTHLKKMGTPTFGGILIICSIMITLFMCGNFNSVPLLATICIMLSYFFLGWLDDYLKVIRRNSDGVSAKGKLLWQFVTSLAVSYYLVKTGTIDTNIYLPFIKGPVIDVGMSYILFASIVIVGFSNAVNLTDGLDGLAIGPIIISAAGLAVFSYVTGHAEISSYLLIPHLENAGELTVFSSCMIGAGVGFLWYNSYPAQIFMGDVGALSLGGALGTIAVLTKNEFLFLILGGVFVVEALSVIIQVVSYKLRKKRVFKMAPIHHHFELMGWAEPKVIVRFWIISLFLAIMSIVSLKLR